MTNAIENRASKNQTISMGEISVLDIAEEFRVNVATINHRITYINTNIPNGIKLMDGRVDRQGYNMLVQMERLLQEDLNMSDVIGIWQQAGSEGSLEFDSEGLSSVKPEIIDNDAKILREQNVRGKNSIIEHIRDRNYLLNLVEEEYGLANASQSNKVLLPQAPKEGSLLPDTIRRKLEDFFAYDQRLAGYPLLDCLAGKKWGLTANDFFALINFRPTRKTHKFDCYLLIKSPGKVRETREYICQKTEKVKKRQVALSAWYVERLKLEDYSHLIA